MWDAVSATESSKAEFSRINIEDSSNPNVQKYADRITHIPTVLWMDGAGNLLKQTGMPGDEETFIDAIDSMSRGH